ncbi:unnamed protein product [Malus baccata var. baccata]
MACNVSVVHQAMASAIAQPNKAPPQPSCAHLSLSFNSKSKPFKLLRSSQYSFASTFSPSRPQTVVPFRSSRVPNFLVVGCGKAEPLRVMISGHGLVHVADGDLLGAEIASGSENGRRAREHMEQGKLVPDEIVVMVGKIYYLYGEDRLLQPDSQEKGWLLDGYPRSSSQAIALKELGFKPDLFVLLKVPEDILVERVVGRRLDPITGKIYHLKYSPPETQEIVSRLTQRFDNTEETNVEAVLSLYEDITTKAFLIHGTNSVERVMCEVHATFWKTRRIKLVVGCPLQ